MQTFKLFMILLKRNLPMLLTYAGIFMIMAILITSTGQETEKELYQDKQIEFTVIDKDQSTLSKALTAYLAEKNEYVEHSGDFEELQLDMYYREIYYALIIPEGFEAGVAAGEEPALQNYKIHDSAMGYYMDLAVDSYMTSMRAYLAAGIALDEATVLTDEAMLATVEVAMQQATGLEEATAETKEKSNSVLQGYFQTLGYIVMAMILSALGSIMLSINKDNLRRRTNCSSASTWNRNLQIALGTVLFGLAVWALFEVAAIILYGKEASALTLVLAGMNSFCYIMMSVALSIMVGFLAKKEQVLGVIGTVLPLGASFISGIFVPMEVLGEDIIKIAKILPSYWYVAANNDIVNVTKFSEAGTAFAGMGVQLLFGIAFFMIAMVVVKRQR